MAAMSSCYLIPRAPDSMKASAVLSCTPLSLSYVYLQMPPVKQTLRDLRHALPINMLPPEVNDADEHDSESLWDDSDAKEDSLRSAFGTHNLSGSIRLNMSWSCSHCL